MFIFSIFFRTITIQPAPVSIISDKILLELRNRPFLIKSLTTRVLKTKKYENFTSKLTSVSVK